MKGLRLLCLGVGDAFASHHYSSCFALESEGRWLLVDCPHPIRKIVREGARAAGVDFDVSKIDALVVTHLHGDHVSGLEVLGYYFRYVLDRRLIVYTHPASARRLWSGVLAGSMEWVIEAAGAKPRRRKLEDFFELRLLREGKDASIGPFSFTCRNTIHSVPCVGLRFEAARRRLGYSADTRFDPQLIEWLADAHLIVHEATDVGFMHTRLSDLLTLPQAIKRKLRLIHYPDAFDPTTTPLPALRQGSIVDV